MTIIIGVEVFRRYVLGASSTWGEETAIYAFVWMTYIAAAHRVRGRKHLSVELLRNKMNRTQKFCALLYPGCGGNILQRCFCPDEYSIWTEYARGRPSNGLGHSCSPHWLGSNCPSGRGTIFGNLETISYGSTPCCGNCYCDSIIVSS